MSIDPIERTNLILSAGAAAASLALASLGFAASLALGALLEAWNFHGLRRSAQFLFRGHIGSSGGWLGVYSLRMGLLVIGIGVSLHLGADPVGFLIGLSLIMPAAVIESWRARPPVDAAAPALAEGDPSWDRWNAWLAREREADEESEDA